MHSGVFKIKYSQTSPRFDVGKHPRGGRQVYVCQGTEPRSRGDRCLSGTQTDVFVVGDRPERGRGQT